MKRSGMDPESPESAKPLMSPSSPNSAALFSPKRGDDDVTFSFPPAGTQSEAADHVSCGAGNCRPHWLQRFADIRVFTLVLSIMSLLNGVVFAYYNAIITSIENRFGLSSSTMGLLKNVDNVGYLLAIILVSHFGRYANKPRLFAAACVLSACATLMFAFPHFIYGAGVDSDELRVSGAGNASLGRRYARDLTHFCDADSSAQDDAQCAKDAKSRLGKFNAGALAFFVASEVLQGMSNAPATSLGITYMDDNAQGSDSPKYFGWMFATRALAPLIGYGIGAWATSMYVDLSDVDITPRDPRWVGAWWLGFPIIAALMAVWTLPVLLFPPRLPGQTSGVEKSNFKEMAKDLPRAIARLVRNPLYMCLVCGMSLDVYMMGFYTFLPKYIEKHFLKTPALASIVAGVISAFGWALGPVVGGLLLGRFCRRPRGAMRIVVIISLTTALAFLAMMFIGCQRREYAGVLTVKKFDPVLPCNANCSCDARIFEPVCGADGRTYVNACLAGCRQRDVRRVTDNDTDTRQLKYELFDCSCASGEADAAKSNVTSSTSPDLSMMTSGFCTEDCKTFVPYIVVLFLSSLVNGMYIIPVIMTGMRCVDHKDKAMSLALSTGVMQVVGFPAPLFYGFGIDHACLVRDTRCGGEGRCLDYDSQKFRYRLHGLTMVVKGAATIFYLAGLWFSRRYTYEEQRNEPGSPETPTSGKGRAGSQGK